MKKSYLLIFMLFSFFGNAQIVNIPDLGFKQSLLGYYSGILIDTNADGEIQVSEATAVTTLN